VVKFLFYRNRPTPSNVFRKKRDGDDDNMPPPTPVAISCKTSEHIWTSFVLVISCFLLLGSIECCSTNNVVNQFKKNRLIINIMNQKAPEESQLVNIEITNANMALNVMVSFLNVAHKRGCYTLQEAHKIQECIMQFKMAPVEIDDALAAEVDVRVAPEAT
jgi:hypothetical protein